MQPIHGVNDGNRLHLGKVLHGQGPFAGSHQLHRQSFEDDLSQFFPYAASYAAAKRHVAKPRGPALLPLWPESIGVKQLRTLEDRCSLVGVPDAVHHTPAFGDLVTLQNKEIQLSFRTKGQ